VVIDDFDMRGTLHGPSEADAPLIVDADRILAAPVARQSFQAVRRRRAQIVQTMRLVQHIELA
jgi:hypothetical protein